MENELNIRKLSKSYPKTFEKLVHFIIDTKLKKEIKKHNKNVFSVIVQKTIDNLLVSDFLLFFDSIGFVSQVSINIKLGFTPYIRFTPYIWKDGIEVYAPESSYMFRDECERCIIENLLILSECFFNSA